MTPDGTPIIGKGEKHSNLAPLSMADIARKAPKTGGPIAGHSELVADGAGVSFATHLCDVEVDPETGKTDVLVDAILSTYTRNLQRQIDSELDRLIRDSAEKRRRVVIRKGRENYLCLLNFQEAVQRTGLAPENAVGLGLLDRKSVV